MGKLMRAHDWGATPLGAPEDWPQSLRTAVRLLLNTGHPMYIFWGADSLCFYNDAYSHSIGPERHPCSLGRPAQEFWTETWDVIGPQIELVMAGRGATWQQNQLIPITRNGVREDVYWTYSFGPIDDEASGVGGVLVVCSETTEQVKTAKRLAESEQRLSLALSAGRGIGVWDWDVPNDVVVADARYARLYGVEAQRLASGVPASELLGRVHPDDLPKIRERVDAALRTGGLFSEEYRVLRDTGGVRWVLSEGRCELGDGGEALRFAGVSFDITESKFAEARLRELNADLERRVIERSHVRGRTWQVSPDLLGVLNAKGCFESSNPAWQRVLGWTEQEVASMSIFEMLHPDDVDRTRVGFSLTQQGQPAIGFANRFRCKDGSHRWISWVGVPEDGMVYYSGRDITEETARAEALERAEQALRQSQKMEAVGQLTSGLAHDFNNLLAALSGSLELVDRRVAQRRLSEVGRYIDTAKVAVKRAAALTHRLLAFSRQQTLDPLPTDVNRLVGDMEELIRRTIGPGVHLEVVGASGLWPTLVDANQLESALLNLCINASDAMPDGGRLAIETANRWLDDRAAQERDLPPGHYVSVSVSDTGVGMSTEVASKAFDPFFTTKPLGAGTGLGLSMTYGFARQSGGQVRIYSVPGQGTTVCLYLPRAEGGLSTEASPRNAESARQRAEGDTVLVVDDEPAVRLVIVEILEEAGYVVLEAGDGRAGLELLKSQARVDLLITDIGLPGGVNGRQFADAAQALRPDLKVLFITGYAENAAIGNGYSGEGNQVMTKPFAMEALSSKVREILAGAGAVGR